MSAPHFVKKTDAAIRDTDGHGADADERFVAPINARKG
jgi:hypothetical protein